MVLEIILVSILKKPAVSYGPYFEKLKTNENKGL
jgi:hypothetical protein